jgi:hypothetical protein
VVQSSPVSLADIADQDVFALLDQYPVFVDVERDLIGTAIDGDITPARTTRSPPGRRSFRFAKESS